MPVMLHFSVLLLLQIVAAASPNRTPVLELCRVLPDSTAFGSRCSMNVMTNGVMRAAEFFGRTLPSYSGVSAIALIDEDSVYLDVKGAYFALEDSLERISPSTAIHSLLFRRNFATLNLAITYEREFVRRIRSSFSCGGEPEMADDMTLACRIRPGSNDVLHYTYASLQKSSGSRPEYEFVVNVDIGSVRSGP